MEATLTDVRRLGVAQCINLVKDARLLTMNLKEKLCIKIGRDDSMEEDVIDAESYVMTISDEGGTVNDQGVLAVALMEELAFKLGENLLLIQVSTYSYINGFI